MASKKDKNPTENFLSPIKGPELVFGLVGPIGTDLKAVTKILVEELSRVRYKTHEIRVTDLLRDVPFDFKLIESPVEKRYKSYIDAGNKLRQRMSRQDAFSLLAVAAIRNTRRSLTGDPTKPDDRTAYILSQFKRPEEIETLRKVYGRGFVQISAYCSKARRLQDLAALIAKSHYQRRRQEAYLADAQFLIARDDAEEENEFGQRVRDTFPLADVIINADSEMQIRATTSRFIRAFFGDQFVTPSKDEYSMFAAKMASLRSSDLSRQVGAVAVSKEGEILSTGCNEVPRAGGGSYWEGDENDSRDFQLGYDSSARAKREILEDIFSRLRPWLSEKLKTLEVAELVEKAIGTKTKAVLKDAQIMDLLEYGRIVHAEMMAISDAARLGVSLRGSTLYTTTFPCHLCARHIVASGFERVVFIEPYSKSFAERLYPDSIQVGESKTHPGPKVRFESFVGIAPQLYKEIFLKGKRKDRDGNAIRWNTQTADPLLERLVPAYLQIEVAVISALSSKLYRNP